MIAKTLILLVLIGSLSASLWAQGGLCTQYPIWSLSAGATMGDGTGPVYFPSSGDVQDMEMLQAEWGGVGPTCSAVWYPGVDAWSGACQSIVWSCTGSATPPASPVGGSPSTCTAGCPINLGNGNTFVQETDVRLPGLGGGLILTRTWNSTSAGGLQGGIFGPGWVSNYEEQVFLGGDGTMKYARGDGSLWSFASYGNPPAFQLIAPPNGQATLTELSEQNVPVGWMVTFQNGEQRIFNLMPPFVDQYDHYQNNGGWLSSIVDRNGNVTSLTYSVNTQGQPTLPVLSVTDPVGRHLYFNFGSSGYVTSVTSDSGTGINVTYAYGTSPAGSPTFTVTQSDSTFVTYTYDNFGNVLSVTDTNGKLLESHTYDSANRGLSSSRANGVDALTITYP